MTNAIIDSSAVLALLNNESGSEVVLGLVEGAGLSAVNLAEVVAKLVERGMPLEATRTVLSQIPLEIVTFNEELGYLAGELRLATRKFGLSLGDRACLALARQRGWSAVTADRAWTELDIGVEIVQIR